VLELVSWLDAPFLAAMQAADYGITEPSPRFGTRAPISGYERGDLTPPGSRRNRHFLTKSRDAAVKRIGGPPSTKDRCRGKEGRAAAICATLRAPPYW
jgi:hypothetical protein